MTSTSTSPAPSKLKSLPFQTLPMANSVEAVGNETVGIIHLPRAGSLSPNELFAFYAAESQLDDGLSPAQQALELRIAKVTILFQSRVDSKWDRDATMSPWDMGGESPVTPSEVLLGCIADFFDNERDLWQPTGYHTVIQARTIPIAKARAIAIAKEERLVVVTSGHMEARCMYMLFPRLQVPKGGSWRVVADYGGELEPEPEAKPEVRRKKKSTG